MENIEQIIKKAQEENPEIKNVPLLDVVRAEFSGEYRLAKVKSLECDGKLLVLAKGYRACKYSAGDPDGHSVVYLAEREALRKLGEISEKYRRSHKDMALDIYLRSELGEKEMWRRKACRQIEREDLAGAAKAYMNAGDEKLAREVWLAEGDGLIHAKGSLKKRRLKYAYEMAGLSRAAAKQRINELLENKKAAQDRSQRG